MTHLLPRLEFLLQSLSRMRRCLERRRTFTCEDLSGVGDELIGGSLIVIARRSEL